jgi:hypothetical protein
MCFTVGFAGFVRAITIGRQKASTYATTDWQNFTMLNALLLAYALTFVAGIVIVHLVRSMVIR